MEDYNIIFGTVDIGTRWKLKPGEAKAKGVGEGILLTKKFTALEAVIELCLHVVPPYCFSHCLYVLKVLYSQKSGGACTPVELR